jgi:hypothetical protein
MNAICKRWGEWAGGPLKPGFSLSRAVLQLKRVSPQLVRAFVPSIPTRSRPSLTAGYWFWVSPQHPHSRFRKQREI